MTRPVLAGLAAGLAIAPSALAGPELRAEQITEASAPELLIGGPDAIGGVGDWYLANDVVEIIVDDPSRRWGTVNHGGTLVDAGLRDRRNEDQFARLWPLVDMDQRVFLQVDTIRAEVDEAAGRARLVVSGSRGLSSLPRGGFWARFFELLVPDPDEVAQVRVETAYEVVRGESVVHITTTIRNRGESPAPIFAYGDVWMRGGRSMRGFVGNALDPQRARGFHHRSFDASDILGAGDALAAFTHVSVPGVRGRPPIAYAIYAPERTARGQLQFGVTGRHVNFINAFSFDPDWRELSLWRLLRATRQRLAPSASWSFSRRLLITGHADVASTTDVILPELGWGDGRSGVHGRIAPPDLPCVIQVDRDDGAPVTQIGCRSEGAQAGAFRAVLPPGDYVLTLRAPQRAQRRLAVTVEAGRFQDLAEQRFEPPGWLRFAPAFADGGGGRLVVQGLGGTPDPVFDPELLDFRIDGELVASGSDTRELHFVGTSIDPSRVAIPPGRYRITALRGPTHELIQIDVAVEGPDHEVRVPPIALRRVVELPGFVSADLHVHAEASDDSSTSTGMRLRQFVAAGVDVLVSTDHDHLGHYEPALDALDLRGRIRVIQGLEVTSSSASPSAPWSIGHHNAWPLSYRPLRHRKGAPPSQDLTLAELYTRLRAEHGARVVQLNHPREGGRGSVEGSSYFSHLGSAGVGYDPARPIDAEPNRLLLRTASGSPTRAIDFDALELINGKRIGDYPVVREDWHSLLLQGFRRTGTANSDTHGPDQPAGIPRNYVGPLAGWDAEQFDAAIREGRLFGTSGPLITEFTLNGAGSGGLAAAPGGRAVVELAIAAAPWVPVDEVRLVVDGQVIRRWEVVRATDVLRFRRREELALVGDAFVTLEAGAPLDVEPDDWAASHPGPYVDAAAPGFVSAAFANPIFVDVDGDGRWTPRER